MRSRRFVTRPIAVIAVVASLGLAACSSDSDTTATDAASKGAGKTTDGLRDQRYCEVIPTVRDKATLITYVYNTINYNECPEDAWAQLTEEGVTEEFGAEATKLNGPRWWTLDAITSSGTSATGKTFTWGGEGGLETGLRATIESKVGQSTVGDQVYVPNEVERDTVFTFNGGEPVFELTDPDGNVYVMQSYTTLELSDLTFDGLADLGARLTLPEGWSFSTRVLEEDFLLSTEGTAGIAYVINDDAFNSYQRRT